MNKDKHLNEGIDLKRMALYFRKKIWIVLLMALIGGGIGALTYQVVKSINMPIEYQAIAKLYVQFNVDENGEVYQHYNGYTWNSLIDCDPIMNCIMGYLPGYDKQEVIDATSAQILSDIRLLTVTIKGTSEKMVREIQAAVIKGMTGYATLDNELQSITGVRATQPERVYWKDRTAISLVSGVLVFGIITFLIFLYMFITDDAIYVQSDLEKRYDIPAIGVMPARQKGLQPYLQELKANICYALQEQKVLMFIDLDDHSELRAQDLEKILNWEEAGALGGLEKVSGELVWHVKEEDEDEDLFTVKEEKEWTIIPLNQEGISNEVCEKIRSIGKVMLMVPFGNSSASRKLERIISLMKNQGIEIFGIVISEADENYLNRYYS